MGKRWTALCTALCTALVLVATACSTANREVASAPTTAPTKAPTTAPATSAAPTRAVPPPAKVLQRAASSPCTTNHRAKAVVVHLAAQHVWFCARTHVVRDGPVTSGMSGADTETPTGHYEIQGRNRNTTLTLANGKTYAVKYWIPFDAPLYGFHDSSWQDFAYGSAKYKTDGSHGCVHLPLATIKFLYKWAEIGTSVQITA